MRSNVSRIDFSHTFSVIWISLFTSQIYVVGGGGEGGAHEISGMHMPIWRQLVLNCHLRAPISLSTFTSGPLAAPTATATATPTITHTAKRRANTALPQPREPGIPSSTADSGQSLVQGLDCCLLHLRLRVAFLLWMHTFLCQWCFEL